MASPQYVSAGDPQLYTVSYAGSPAQQEQLTRSWTKFRQPDPATLKSYEVWARPTSQSVPQVMVDCCMPPSAPAGTYRIEVFVPSLRATVRDAHYSVAHNFRMENGVEVFDEAQVVVNQAYYNDHWVKLGWYRLSPASNPQSGRVRLTNYSQNTWSWISFTPVRWIYIPEDEDTQQFDLPVGSPEDRAGSLLENNNFYPNKPRWTPGWYDYTPFLEWYVKGVHPGADLNSTLSPSADKGAPVYAIADGLVTFAGAVGSWGIIVVIWHPDALITLPDGTVQRQHIYARYGHLTKDLMVQSGMHVTRGQQIGKIGLMAGATAGWHLHFDLSFTETLRQAPSYWTPHRSRPRFDVRKDVWANYVDPFNFLRDNHKVLGK